MQYDNKLVVGEFILKPNNPIMLYFLNDYDFTNLIKLNSPPLLKLVYVTVITLYTQCLRHHSRMKNQKYSFTVVLKNLLLQIFNLS